MPRLVQISNRRDLAFPAVDTLFTSGTLGRYSPMLSDVERHQEQVSSPAPDHTAAD